MHRPYLDAHRHTYLNAFNFVMALQISFKFIFSLFNYILFNIKAYKCQLFSMLMKMGCIWYTKTC